jgi:endogenous inhibitor of DNA gyrase (YacG/DUF329 family)
MYDVTFRVPQGGFTWISGTRVSGGRAVEQVEEKDPLMTAGAEEFLVAKDPRSGETEVDPFLTVPDLFRHFAATPPAADAVLRFADGFGPLGVGNDLHPAGPAAPAARLGRVRGEALGDWVEAIEAMRRAVEVWDLCVRDTRQSERLLSHLITWDPDRRAVRYTAADPPGGPTAGGPGRSGRIIAARKVMNSSARPLKDVDPDFARLTPGDLVLPGVLFVEQEINRHLPRRAAPRLYWAAGDVTLDLAFRPATLIEGLWLQFAAAVRGKFVYRECDRCGRWVRLGPKRASANRQFCSNACKMQDLRARQARAVTMFRESKPLKEIAAALRSDVRTVRKWVTADRKAKG